MTDLFKCFNFFDSFGFLIEVILEISILQCNLWCEENYEKELTAGVLKTHQQQICKRSHAHMRAHACTHTHTHTHTQRQISFRSCFLIYNLVIYTLLACAKLSNPHTHTPWRSTIC